MAGASRKVRSLSIILVLTTWLCQPVVASGTNAGVARAAAEASDASPCPADPALSPDEIFGRARDAWTGQRYPARIEYVVTVSVVDNGATLQNHYKGQYLWSEDDIRVIAFSDEETAHPYVPHGVNLLLTVTIAKGGSETIGRQVGPRAATIDYLGLPVVDPVYSFGLARPARAFPPASANGGAPPNAALKTIGRVASRQLDYAVALVGIERYGGSPTFHLSLEALHEPRRYRLREMWVDTDTFATRKVVTEGNFSDGPPLHTMWATTFQQIDGAQYIETETARGLLDYGPGRRYTSASVSFEAIRPAPSRPSALLFKTPARDDELREPTP